MLNINHYYHRYTGGIALAHRANRKSDGRAERLLRALEGIMEFATQYAVKPGFWAELSEAQKRRINLPIKQLDEGEYIPHETVMAEFRTKLRKVK